jgi:hypothetical protein
VLVVSSPTVHRELLQLIERHGAGALPSQVLEQVRAQQHGCSVRAVLC